MSVRHLRYCFFVLLMGTLASLASAAAVEPFKFESTPDDHDSQQAEWDLLIKYKLFGTGVETTPGNVKGIYFNGQQIYITDEIGFVGSAKGNLDMSGNIRHSVGGPMLFGGNFVNGDGKDTLMTGPTRFKGNFTVTFNSRETNVFHGYNCVGGTVNEHAEKDIKAHGTLLSAEDCATDEKVPFVDTKLEIPVVDNPSAVYEPAISINGGSHYIDVPPYSGTGDKVYDIYISSISFGNGGKLYIRMPQNGRLTRIFLKETITGLGSTSGTNIEVLHAFGGGVFEGDGKEYEKDQWNGSSWDYTEKDAKNVVSNLDYAGNLLFYTPRTISMGAGQKNLQGTYIMGEDLVIAQNTTFAGQFLARSIQIDAEFKAKDFRYVPFDPPVIRVGANSDLQEQNELVGDTIRLALDSVPPTMVPFRYCFEFPTKGRNMASRSDLVDENLPVCSEGDTISSKFEKGSKTPVAPIILHAANDGELENTETFRMYVCDIEAAVFPDGDRQGRCFPFAIKIIDGTPIPADTTFNVNENVKAKTVVGMVKTAKSTVNPQFQIIDPSGIFDVDAKGNIVVKKDSTINFEQEDIYFVHVIRLDGTVIKDTADVYIYVQDVNEPPAIRDTTYKIYENAAADTAVGVLPYFDEDEEESGFRKNSFSLVGGDSAFFSIDAATGKISAKKTFDYEALPADKKFYTVKVKISDPDGYSSTADVKIEILDVMEKSEIVVTLVESDNGDTKVEKPTTTVNMNVNSGVISWTADGKTMPDTVLTNLHEGKNVITLSYRDSTRNEPVTKDVVIFVCTKTPSVMMSTDSNNVTASNIYTIVEKIEEGDTSFYVNKTKKDLVIEIKEPILDSTYTDSTCNYKTTPVKISVDLDTLKTSPSAAVKDLGAIANKKVALNESAAGATHTLYNDSLILVTYKDKIDGKDVVVSYLTNSKGDLVEDNFKASYETTVDGKTVTVSYEADAATGEPVKNKDGVLFEVSTKKDGVTVAYQVDASGKVIKDANNNVGYTVTFSYKTEFGNEASKSIYVVVDKVGPKVEIKSPVDNQVIHSNMVEVEWYVDYGDGKGPQLQKDLVTQGLTKGPNVIVRYYKDKAGNEAADTVFVIMKDAKDVDISVETPVTIITRDKVAEYYAANELKKGQTYAVTIYNSKFDKEVETLTGGSYKPKPGSGNEPYPGLEGHLGPTLAVDVKVPSINALGGLATLDDMMDENGMVLLEDVDAGKKATVDDYVKEYCSADFATSFNSDPARANLYKTTMEVKIWVFTSLGSFVDYFTFKQELDDPDYANDAGLLTLYFEQKPDKNGDVRTKDGRLYGTGAYVYKTEVTLRSKLQCTLYPASGSPEEKGRVRKTTDDLLKPFGYKRPQDK